MKGLTRIFGMLSILNATALLAQMSPDAETRFNNGLNHLRDGRVELALDEFKKAIKEDPKNPYFYKGLGLAYARQNKMNDAITSFRKALDLNPYYVDVRNDIGSALILSEKREEGKKEFLTAFGDPTNPTPETSARNLGQAYFEEKKYDDAMGWFQTSRDRNKAYPDAYLGLADTLIATGKTESAVSQLETAVEAIPEDASLIVALGEAYYRAGRFGEARTRLEQAVRKDPTGNSGQRATHLLKNFPK